MKSYKDKYLKYKTKYFNLKKSIGGSVAKPEGSPKTTAPKSGSPVAKPKILEKEAYSWTSGTFIPKYDQELRFYQELEKFNFLVVKTFNFKLKDGTEKSRFGFKWWNDVKEKSIKSLKSGITNKSSKEVIDSLYKEFIGKIFDIKDVDTTSAAGDYIRSINLFTIDVGFIGEIFDKKKKIHFRIDFGLPNQTSSEKGFPYDLGFEPNKSGGVGKRTSDFVNFSCRWVREGFDNYQNLQSPKTGKVLSLLYFDDKTGYDTKEKKFKFKTIALNVPEFNNFKDKFAETFNKYMNQLLRKYVKFINIKDDADPDNNIEAFLELFHKLWEKSREFYYNISLSATEKYKRKKNQKAREKRMKYR